MLGFILILILLCLIDEETFWALLTVGATVVFWGALITLLIVTLT